MALRGKKAADITETARLKGLLFSKAGVGKTTAALQMPKPYIIDGEKGTVHYGKLLKKSGASVFHVNDFDEVVEEVRSLLTEKHDFKTLVIDPFTSIWEAAVDAAEKEVGSEFGRHYALAGKKAKRLYNLITQLDMNVIMTAHSKNEYAAGEVMKVIGQTFDGWKKLDYLFDIVFLLERRDTGERIATVKKTRLEGFEDQSRFEWSYDALAERYGRDKLEADVKQVKLADDAQVDRFKYLYHKLNEDDIKRLKLNKVVKNMDEVQDLPTERLGKGIELIENFLESAT